MAESVDEPSTSFRRIKKRPQGLRRQEEPKSDVKDADEDPEEESNISLRLEDIHDLQSGRKRRNGLTALECALGKKLAAQFDEFEDNPFRTHGGGMFELSDDKKKALEAANIESDIKDQFRKETLLRDEHEEMTKYIEQRLNPTTDDPEKKKVKFTSPEDAILLKVAEKFRGVKSRIDDELLSNQMLVGIPEVDLGIEARMNNVLETERRKAELLENADKLNY